MDAAQDEKSIANLCAGACVILEGNMFFGEQNASWEIKPGMGYFKDCMRRKPLLAFILQLWKFPVVPRVRHF